MFDAAQNFVALVQRTPTWNDVMMIAMAQCHEVREHRLTHGPYRSWCSEEKMQNTIDRKDLKMSFQRLAWTTQDFVVCKTSLVFIFSKPDTDSERR